jgi:hypothetical protein
MPNSSPLDADTKVLSESSAARLLARARELDQLHSAGSTVADLRVAATEAGIAAPAFDAALAELQRGNVTRAPALRDRARRRVVIVTVMVAVLAVATALVVASRRARITEVGISSPPMLDDAIVLQCLAPAEAAEIIKPLLTLRANQVIVRATDAPRVLSLRATAAQLEQVKARLAPYEVAGSPTCRTRPVR